MQRLSITLLFFLLTVCAGSFAQDSYLDKQLSLSYNNEPIKNIFRNITEQTGAVFSYNPKEFDDAQQKSVYVKDKPLRYALNEIFENSGFTYRTRKNYIIITKVKVVKPSLRRIEGMVYNSADSSLLMNVSVYSGEYKIAVVTDERGYFTFTLPEKAEPLNLTIAKESFNDTSVTVSAKNSRKLSLYISPKQIEITASSNSDIEQKTMEDLLLFRKAYREHDKEKRKHDFIEGWLAKRRNKVNLRNISDTLFNNASVSFVPYLSTNKILSINTINKFSFNVLAGYSKGTEVFEFGGLLNINNGPVSYAQIAGVGNVVSDNVKGAQIGGVFNIVQKSVAGCQIGGVFNTTRSFNGAQIGGVFNHNVDTLKGFQLGGVFNNSRHVYGMQLAGVFNRAGTVKGAQVSGLINYAKHVKGMQLGFINIADTCDGVPIGFLSFVKNGYHKLELAVNESGIATIGFGTGVEKFHTKFFVGTTIEPDPDYFAYGYGIGSNFRLSKRFLLGMDFTSQQTQPMDIIDEIYLNLHNKAQLNVEFEVFKKLRISAGPSFNVMVADNRSPYYHDIAALYNPRQIFNETGSFSSITTTMWLGAGAAIKLF